MNHKSKPKAISKAKTHLTDAKKPKKKTMDGNSPTQSAPDTAPRLDIQSRPMVRHDVVSTAPTDQAGDAKFEPTSAPPVSSAAKRTLVVPVKTAEDDVEAASAADENKTGSTPDTSPSGAETPAPPVLNPDEPSAAKPDNEPGIQEDVEVSGPAGETKQAVEAAAALAKHDNEVENLISSHEYYVPINAVARKRSIRASVLLTLLVVLLAVTLVDLMLDSGMILLVQKIPHTHFFSNNSGVCHTAGFMCSQE